MDIAELRDELEKHHTASFGWALSCCRRDRVEAEEVLQTVYLKILEGKARFGGEATFRTWLFAVIRKTAAGEHRKGLLRKLRFAVSPEQVRESGSAADEPANALEKSETRLRFQRALERLPRRQREVLHLVFYEALTVREAGEVMGVSIGSARQHYERGKKRLRKYLGQTETDYGVNWKRTENPRAV